MPKQSHHCAMLKLKFSNRNCFGRLYESVFTKQPFTMKKVKHMNCGRYTHTMTNTAQTMNTPYVPLCSHTQIEQGQLTPAIAFSTCSSSFANIHIPHNLAYEVLFLFPE